MSLIIKFAKPKRNDRFPTWDYSNKDAVEKCVHYIRNGMSDLPEEEQLFGFIGIPEGVSIGQAIAWMIKAKKIHGAEEGVQCRHVIISFGKKPEWKKKKFVKLVEKIVGIWKGRFQVCWGYHHENVGTPRENFHLHLMVNSVDMKTGKRLDLDYKRWRKFKKNAKRKWEAMIAQDYITAVDG